MTDEKPRDLMARLRQSLGAVRPEPHVTASAPAQGPAPKQPAVATAVRIVGKIVMAVFWFVVVTVTIIAYVTDTRLILAAGCSIIFFGWIKDGL